MRLSFTVITAEDVLNLIRKLMNFPAPTVCRHYVTADLLSLMESRGYPVDGAFVELVDAVIACDDDRAIELIDSIKAATSARGTGESLTCPWR